MTRLLLSVILLFGCVHAAGPVRVAFDAKVVDWNNRCIANNSPQSLNTTQELLASSYWIGQMREAGYYPAKMVRANLICGGSYGGTNGCGNSTTVTNLGSPLIPLINDVGLASDSTGAAQHKWSYASIGSSGGLGAVTTNTVWINTHTTPANIVAVNGGYANDAGFAIYMQGGGEESSACIGLAMNSGNVLGIDASFTGSGQLSIMWTASGFPTSADTNGAGFYFGTRTSSGATGVQQYHNNLATGSSSSVGGTPATMTLPIYVLGQNNEALGLNGQSFHKTTGYAFMYGLTATQVTNKLYNAWQQFETLLGRQK